MTLLHRYQFRYRFPMAMNLRLPEELAGALKALSDETGRSQQDLAREALAEYIRDYPLRRYPVEMRPHIRVGDRTAKLALPTGGSGDDNALEVLLQMRRDRI